MMNEKKDCGCGSKAADKATDRPADCGCPSKCDEKSGASGKDMNETKSCQNAAKK